MRDFARSDAPAVQRQLDRLAALSLPQGRLGLEPVRELLARVGDPHLALPPVFHVAGTNGKGSTCAFLRTMLESAGHRVHAFTSPHLVRYNERIRLAGRLIEDDLLAALLEEVLDAAGAIGASFFEVTTAAAFLGFARTPADACVIEVGLGGRFDASNVIPRPLVCGIASLGIDHEAFLLVPEEGTPDEPIARIAFEKAGIAKPGVPLVTMGTLYSPPARAAIAATAARVGAPLFEFGDEWAVKAGGGDRHLVYSEGSDCYFHAPPPALIGRHQVLNAGLAIAMMRRQSVLAVDEAALKAGVAAARWPARMQRLGQGPVTALVPGRAVWLDGGHNPDAGEALAAALPPGKLHLVIGMLANKDPAALLRPLADRLASVSIVPVPGHEAHDPATLAAQTAAPVRAFADVPSALAALPPGGDVLIAGSLYLAGEVLRLNAELPD